MVGKLDTHPLDGQIAELARRQYGVVTRAQLHDVGLSRQAVDKRVRAGRLHRVHRGVYAVGHARLTKHARYLAAVLACGEGAVLSHASAAELWRLPCPPERSVHVTVPGRGGRAARNGIVVHRAALPEDEMTKVDGIPVTTPVRTVIDLADTSPRRTLERALDEAAYLRLDLSGLKPRPGRRGAGLLATVLAEHTAGTTRTRSELEELLLDLCHTHRLPRPEVNGHVLGYEIDFLWRPQRLVVETDSVAAHGTRAAFERDRVRDADLTAAGWRVVRITYRRLATSPDAVARLLRRLLRLAGRD
jgi:predicted transcriptional regulator of viral defense system